MPADRMAGVLYDSEAMLRLVVSELGALKVGEPVPQIEWQHDAAPAIAARAPVLASLPFILQHAGDEIAEVLGRLRASEATLDRESVERIVQTRATLQELTAATETATARVLDGLDTLDAEIDRLAGR